MSSKKDNISNKRFISAFITLPIGIYVLIHSVGQLFGNTFEKEPTSIPASIQGVYTYKYRMKSTARPWCYVHGIKLNDDNAQLKVFDGEGIGCAKNDELEFDNGNVTTYDIRDIVIKSEEEVSFDLYLDDVKEYECSRVFGSMSCGSKDGDYETYNPID